MVEDVHGSPSLLIVLSVTRQVQHALQSYKLLTAVSLQNVVEGVHESLSLLLTALAVPHLKVL